MIAVHRSSATTASRSSAMCTALIIVPCDVRVGSVRISIRAKAIERDPRRALELTRRTWQGTRMKAAFTADEREAWVAVYTVVATTMKAGATVKAVAW